MEYSILMIYLNGKVSVVTIGMAYWHNIEYSIIKFCQFLYTEGMIHNILVISLVCPNNILLRN